MSIFDEGLADAVLAALDEEETRISAGINIDRYSFLRGWLWGVRFAEYRRYFKDEYWRDYIKAEAKEDAPSK